MNHFTIAMYSILGVYCAIMYCIGCNMIISGDRNAISFRNISWKFFATAVLAPVSLPYLAIRSTDD